MIFFGFILLKGFNSTLVRLEDPAINVKQRIRRVSIPLWFDWKPLATRLRDSRSCFNSTLVRLEALRKKEYDIINKVSIPLWFDWK